MKLERPDTPRCEDCTVSEAMVWGRDQTGKDFATCSACAYERQTGKRLEVAMVPLADETLIWSRWR